MSALSYFLLASTFSLTTSYTLITPGEANKFTEDWAYQATSASFTNSSESWWSKASAAMEDLGRTDTFIGNTIWGWWRFDTNDPSNMFMRYFRCSSHSTAYISFDVYHCSYTYDGQSRLYYNRLSTDAGSANIEIEYGDNGITWEYLDNGPCGEPVKKTTVTDSFITSSTRQFSITFTKDLERARLQSDTVSSTYSRQIVAFKNMEIKCDRIETDSPSPAPTGATAKPSTPPSKFPTPAPTTNPSQTPTKAPVTARPSMAPITDFPTPAPTDVPSRFPTETPSLTPTKHPTSRPTTATPSHHPTSNQTSNPSEIQTFEPTTFEPTTSNPSSTDSKTTEDLYNYVTTEITNLVLTYDYDAYQQQLEDLSASYQSTAIPFVILFGLIVLCGWIDAKFVRINDYFKFGSVITMGVQSLDMVSDCFFTMDISIQSKMDSKYSIPSVFSILFIVIPSFVSIIQLYHYSRKHWLWKRDNVRIWLQNNSKTLYFLSILTGSSFSAVSLLNSYIFRLQLFNMGLNTKELLSFTTKRVYSVVLLENLPQLGLQTWYLYSLGDIDNGITISSIILSLISIIVSIMSMTMEKSIIQTQGFVTVSMDVTGKCVKAKANKCRTIKHLLTKEIALLVGVNHSTIEITKPISIPNGGLSLDINFYFNDVDKTPVQFEKLLVEANKRGDLQTLFKESWQLFDEPIISNIKSIIVQSKTERKKTEVDMLADTMYSSEHRSAAETRT